MDGELTIEDLSARLGEPPDELRRWQSLGLIGEQRANTFSPQDLDRARLVRILLQRGIDLDDIVKAEQQRPFLGQQLGRIFGGGAGPRYSLAEASQAAAFDLETARRLWRAGNLGDEDSLSGDDVAMLEGLRRVLDAGYPEEALLQVFRVWADSLDRAAEAGIRAFHFYVHEPLRASAASSPTTLQQADTVSAEVNRLAEPTLLYFFRKATAKAALDDVAMHVAEGAGLIQVAETPGQMTRAVVFVDLTSFTPLTEAMGDSEAAAVLERFSDLVRTATAHCNGRVVKQIGDGFMLVFPDPASAISCALDIEARASAERSFPAARAGVHWGEVLYRDGDYVGTNVNIASRIAGKAKPHQVVVTASARKAGRAMPGVEFSRIGKRRLKGLPDEQDLFEVRFASAERREKSVDPVCGMELGPDEAAATLTLEGRVRTFCSDECLRRFVAAPERYVS